MKRSVLAVAVGMFSCGSFAHAQTCASATTLARDSSYVSDTTTTTNWMFQFGPLASPSNDMLYTFIAGPQPLGTITPTASNYLFAMYLIPSCSDGGSEVPPIRATATVGSAITLSDPPPPGQPSIMEGARYYLAVTGTAAGGATANGTVAFQTPFPVTLLTFTVD